MNKLYKILIITLSFNYLLADQASWITKREATKASELINIGDDIYQLCEPCGETVPLKVNVKNVLVKNTGVERYHELQINGEGVDLAYVFINKDNKYFNLAMLLEIPVSGVSEVLEIASNIDNSQDILGFIFVNFQTSYDLFYTLFYLTDLQKDLEGNKTVIEFQISMLKEIISSIENNGDNYHNNSNEVKNILDNFVALADDLLVGYNNFLNFLNFETDNFKEKTEHYLQSFEKNWDAFIKLMNN